MEAQKPGPDSPQDLAYNTKPWDFRLMHKTIQSMSQCKAAAKERFAAILFEWQACLPQP